jgi:hypothetical protein
MISSLDHPESWNLPSMKGQYMFGTKEACCEVFFLSQGKACLVQDSCSGTTMTITLAPTSRPTDHPTTLNPTKSPTKFVSTP